MYAPGTAPDAYYPYVTISGYGTSTTAIGPVKFTLVPERRSDPDPRLLQMRDPLWGLGVVILDEFLAAKVEDGRLVPLEGEREGDQKHQYVRLTNCWSGVAVAAVAVGESILSRLFSNPTALLQVRVEALTSAAGAGRR